MPGPVTNDQYDDLSGAVQQIILSSSETDYLDQLIPLLKSSETHGQVTALIHALNHVSADREAEIEAICNSNHQEFINSVNQLQSVREGTVTLTSEIIELSRSIEASTEKLAEQKRALVDSRGVRQNIDDTTQALKDCLEVLRLANQVHDLLSKKNHYAALRTLDELQNVHLREVTRFKIADMIERSVPATQRLIAEAVMTDLNTWLFRIRETSQFLGEVAFYHTEMRRTRQKERSEKDEYSGSFKLNSAVELVADEPEEFDVLNNEEVSIDFSPLFEGLHIHNALGETEKFRAEYAATRRRQKDLLIPQSINLLDDDNGSLSSFLESVAGFAIVEKATMLKTESFRSQTDVDELWDSVSQAAASLISNSLHNIDNDETLLKIKGVIALFIQTMDSWGYPITTWDGLLLTLFDRYSALLKKRFSDDFQEIVSTDDYMPMPVNNAEEYSKVISVSWYNPPQGHENAGELVYPCVLPFSQMYPLVCIDIRNFLNQTYLFSDDHFRHTTVIDRTLKESLDELLVDKVCRSLLDELATTQPGKIVQILTNLEHFSQACNDLEELLVDARSSSSAAGPIKLNATNEFEIAKQKAERRIFELINSKIDDLIETADYDWVSVTAPDVASGYIHDITRYLSNIMSSALLGLREDIKIQLYSEALKHICNAVQTLPLDPSVQRISAMAVLAYKIDVDELHAFVEGLPDAQQLTKNMEELRQISDLMGLASQGKSDEFFDSSRSALRFGMVNRMAGTNLIEKVAQGAPAAASAARPERNSLMPDLHDLSKKSSMSNFGDFRERFGQFTKRDRS